MSKQQYDKLKELRVNTVYGGTLEFRADENDSGKMIIEGYPIIFNKEAYIEGWDGGFYEKIDPAAFNSADMDDVVLKYNHNDNIFILARTKNGSLTLTVDEIGVFIHAELIDTTTNIDVHKMVRAGLLTEGSFAFTVAKDKEEIQDGDIHRTILAIDRLFDVAICVNGAYGSLTSINARGKEQIKITDIREIYARSYEALESVKTGKREALKRVSILKLRNKNKIKLGGVTHEN